MKTKAIIADLSQQLEIPNFKPTRAAGLARLRNLRSGRVTYMISAATTTLDRNIALMFPHCRRGYGTD